MVITLVDGVPANMLPADDRGLAYGDGIFRTLAMRRGIPEFWDHQYAKLTADCRMLGITPPVDADLRQDIVHIAGQMPDCALRITITRGSGGRGYTLPTEARPRRVVTASELPDFPESNCVNGVQVRICSLRLAAQPRLAGIKHLNRLENVLARTEWNDPAIAEGLLFDTDGNVISGTRSNVFIVESDGLATPDLSRCGVAGVTRDLIIGIAHQNNIQCRVEPISRARMEKAHEIFLVNSLIGVWPVAMLGQRMWADFTMTARVRKWLDALRYATH